jgi:hypothetical protein
MADDIITTDAEDTDTCRWFALCVRPTRFLISHPANRAGVPTCQPCHDWLMRMSDGGAAKDVLAVRVPD